MTKRENQKEERLLAKAREAVLVSLMNNAGLAFDNPGLAYASNTAKLADAYYTLGIHAR